MELQNKKRIFVLNMRRLSTIFCLLLFFVKVMPLTRTESPFIVQHYSVEDGLPNDIVNCSLKTKDGFMWFGTWYGLCRFDGLKFYNFSNSYYFNSDQSPRKVETIVEDGTGNIWIKTLDWKLSVFFKSTERFETVFDELKPYSHNLQIIKIQSDGHGKVLLLTKDKNLLLASTNKNGNISIRLIASSKGKINPFNSQLTDNLIDIRNGYAAFVGKDYKIFAIKISNNKKLRKGNISFWKKYFDGCSYKADFFYDMDGNKWTVDHDMALVYYNSKTHITKRFPLSLYGRITNPAFCDAGVHGMFFLSSAGEAIHIDKKSLTATKVSLLPEVADNISDSRYFSMRIDREGILWLTTTNNGIFKFCFPPRQFRIIHLPQTEKEGVRALYQQPNGDIWVGLRSKDLYILDRNGNIKYNLSYSKYKIGSAYFIMKDSKGRLWLSTKGDGLVVAISDKFSPVGYRFVHYHHDNNNKKSISGNNVYITYEDHQHRIWVGTLDGGLNLVNEKNGIEFLNKFNGMRNYPIFGLYMEVRNMVEDRKGRMWVGTIDGLMSFDNHFKNVSEIKFDTYRQTEVNTLANSDIYALYKDRKENIWICTFGGGLSKIIGFDHKKHLPVFETIRSKEGPENDVIISVLEDKHGQLWLGNTKGLSCFNSSTNCIRNFDITDGFPAVTMEETASLLNNNGEIWLGCKDGIVAFNPSKLVHSSLKYPVYIVGLTVNNQDYRSLPDKPTLQSITYTDKFELRYDQNMFNIEFAALNYKGQHQISYRHRLKGFDKDWHYDGQNRLASYTNVPPGRYVFVVEAHDNSNPGNSGSLSVKITILPPWWATWWAYSIYTILFVVAISLLAKYAKYQLRLKNDIYVQSKLAEYKRKYELEQADAHFVETVNKVIEENLSKPDFELDVIFNKVGMSRSTFFKKIKAITGLSPSEYLKEYKLNKSLELLKNTNMSITDIAYISGFSEVGYFGKCFRKRFGVNPRDLKKKDADNR